MKRIFADMHHAGLYYSFHLLFEKRLGYELYRPIGTEWFTEGFWNIARPYGDNIATVNQYLSIGSTPPDESPPLNHMNGLTATSRGNLYSIRDEYHDYNQRAITIDAFKSIEFDYIIASIPDHWKTYTELRDRYQPKAKVLCHMGNMFDEVRDGLSEGVIKNLLASTIKFPIYAPTPINAVFYYQEMPIIPFVPTYPETPLQIASFVHLLPSQELWERYRSAMPEVAFKAFGAGAPDGWMRTLKQLYGEMQKSQLVWHVKPRGDGFGWNWHSAFMVGRPVITNFSDYRDKLGAKMFEEDVTGIDLEQGDFDSNVARLREVISSARLVQMQEHANIRFESVINFSIEAEKINAFLHHAE